MEGYKITNKVIKGETDLISTNPYRNAHDWPYFDPAFDDVTEEGYKENPTEYEERVKKANSEYIEKLKMDGLYLKEEDEIITVCFQPMPDFINPQPMQHRLGLLIPKGDSDVNRRKFNVKWGGASNNPINQIDMTTEEQLKNLKEDFEAVKMAIDAQVKCLPHKERQRFYSIQQFMYNSLKEKK